MTELSDQIDAHKARQQRFEAAAANHYSKCHERADAEQVVFLENCVPALPPIPDEAIRIACEIAFPKLIMNHVEACQRATLREFPTITMLDLKSQRRTKAIVEARQVAMFVAKKATAQSLFDIGRRFGGRDHSTAHHAIRKIEALVAIDPNLAAKIERIMENIPEVGGSFA